MHSMRSAFSCLRCWPSRRKHKSLGSHSEGVVSESLKDVLKENENPPEHVPDKKELEAVEISNGLRMFEDKMAVKRLPQEIMNDVISKSQLFIDRVKGEFDPDFEYTVIQSLYEYMEQQLDPYGAEVDRDDIRLFLECYAISRIYYRIPRHDQAADSKFQLKMEAAHEFMALNNILLKTESNFLNLSTLSLVSLTYDWFPDWKWGCVKQWGRNVDSLAKSQSSLRKAKDGGNLFLSTHSLLASKNLPIQDQIDLIRHYGHPYHSADKECVYYWNLLVCAVEVVEVFCHFYNKRTKENIPLAMDKCFKMCAKIEANDSSVFSKETSSMFNSLLRILVEKQSGWKGEMAKFVQGSELISA